MGEKKGLFKIKKSRILTPNFDGGHKTRRDKMTDIVLKDEERQPCEVWTRVMGYFRPYNHFNVGKKQEFDDRKWFVESKCGCVQTEHQDEALSA